MPNPLKYFPGATRIMRPYDEEPSGPNDTRLLQRFQPHGFPEELLIGYGEHGEPDSNDYFEDADFGDE